MKKEEMRKPSSGENSEEAKPTPRELFFSCIGWVIAAVLVLIIPTAILCGDPGKVILIVIFVLLMAAVFTFIACTGWK